MAMDFRALTIEDLGLFDGEPAFKDALREYVDETQSRYARIGQIDGRPVFAAGVVPYPWHTTGEIWIRVFDETHALAVVRAARRLLKWLCGTYSFHRLEAVVRADDARTLRFDQWMGFVIEGRKTCFYEDRCDAVILRYLPDEAKETH